jgi:hypothetical protein
MLLSILISFLLARRFRSMLYEFLTITALVLVSYFSFGFPTGGSYPTPSYYPIPLSFPFHSIGFTHPSFGMLQVLSESYELYFLNIPIEETWHMYPLSNKLPIFFGLYQLKHPWVFHPHYRFFFLVNVVGAIFGYWISKTAFIDKLLTRRKTKVNPA